MAAHHRLVARAEDVESLAVVARVVVVVVVAVLGAGALAACSFDGAVPAGAALACARDDECPAGDFCAASIGRCRALAGRDTTPPSVADVVVDPAFAGGPVPPSIARDGALVVHFTASEPLFALPVVRAAGLVHTATLAVTDDGADGLRFRASIAADDANVDEGPVDIAATLVDDAGNEAQTLLAAHGATFDFTAPAVVSASAAPAVSRPNTALVVRVDMQDADLSTTPLLESTFPGIAPFTTSPAAVAGAGLTFTLVVPSDSGDGTVSFALLDAVDAAGNASARTALDATTVIDATPPNATFAINASIFGPGDDVVLTVTVADVASADRDGTAVVATVDGTPCIDVPARTACASSPAASGVPDAVDLLCTCTNPAASFVEGLHLVVFDVVDPDGNSTSDEITFQTDLTAPAVADAFLTLTASPGEPVRVEPVHALGVGAAAHLAFSLSEPPNPDGPATSLVAVDDVSGAQFPVALTFAPPVTFLADIVVDGATPNGTFALRATFEDAAGSPPAGGSALLPVAPLVVDTVAPDPPSGGALAGIVYERAPFDAPPTFVLTQDTGAEALPPSTTLVVWDQRALDGTGEIGRTAVDGAGHFAPFPLDTQDTARVFVSLIDDAGNVDAVVPHEISRVLYHAGVRGRRPLDAASNPNAVATTARFAKSLAQPEAQEAFGDRVADAGDGNALSATPIGRWQRWPGPSPSGSGAIGVHAAYDARRGRGVIFGGCSDVFSGQNCFEDTWEWDGRALNQIDVIDPEADQGPIAHFDSAMGFDAMHGTVDLIQGHTEWDYDGASYAAFSASVPDLDLTQASVVSDERRGVLVVLDTVGAIAERDASGTWTKRTDLEQFVQHSLACWDPSIEAMVLVGARGSTSVPAGPTVLSYNGALANARFATGAFPDVGSGVGSFSTTRAAIACDENGDIEVSDVNGEIWRMSAADLTWTRLGPVGANALFSDPDTGTAVAVAAAGVRVGQNTKFAPEIWRAARHKPLTRLAPQPQTPAAFTDPDFGPGGGSDVADGTVLVVDGLDESWSWNGSGFTSFGLINPAQFSRPLNVAYGAADDVLGVSGNQRSYVRQVDDWVEDVVFDGTTGPLIGAFVSDPDGALYGIGFDGTVVVVKQGGFTTLTQPGAFAACEVKAVDLPDDGIFLVDACGELFVYSIADGIFSDLGGDPGGIGFVADAARDTIGFIDNGGGVVEDLGGGFSFVPREGPTPPQRTSAAYGYDVVRDELVLFGGDEGRTDTWTWRSLGTASPAVLIDIDARASGLLATHDLASVVVRAGGDAANGDVIEDVRLWARGRWRPLVESTPGLWQLADGDVVFLTDAIDHGHVHAAVTTSVPFGSNDASEVGVDLLAVDLAFALRVTP